MEMIRSIGASICITTVSYTHLDVYKRQFHHLVKLYRCERLRSVTERHFRIVVNLDH